MTECKPDLLMSSTPFTVTNEVERDAAVQRIEALLRRVSETAREAEALIAAVHLYEASKPEVMIETAKAKRH